MVTCYDEFILRSFASGKLADARYPEPRHLNTRLGDGDVAQEEFACRRIGRRAWALWRAEYRSDESNDALDLRVTGVVMQRHKNGKLSFKDFSFDNLSGEFSPMRDNPAIIRQIVKADLVA